MLDHLIEENDLWPLFESWGLTQTDLTFIKEIIASCQIKSEEVGFFEDDDFIGMF